MTAQANPDIAAVLVIGAGGMLGRDVSSELARRGVTPISKDRAACDITELVSLRSAAQELQTLCGSGGSRRGVVINCAAYTDVNRAESEETLALAINGDGPGHLASVCRDHGFHLVHVSTDYVFDGTKAEPYETEDATFPINAYGRTKLAGEVAINQVMAEGTWAVARTSWLYGVHGPNFVKTMLRLAGEGRDMKVIGDQVGAPTYTADLARALVDIALEPRARGILHVTNSGSCSWFEFARAIFEDAGIQPKSLVACATADFPTPARRPANSRLSPASLLKAGIAPLPDWRDGLRHYLAQESGVCAKA